MIYPAPTPLPPGKGNYIIPIWPPSYHLTNPHSPP